MKVKNFFSKLFAGRNKIFWAIGGVDVLIVIGGAYFISPWSPFRESAKPSDSLRGSSSGDVGSGGGSGDQMYTNDQADISFNYPSDWEVKSEYYYETAAGEKSTVPTIILGRKSDPANATLNQISINLRQATCEGSASPTYESAGAVQVAIYTHTGSSQKCMESTLNGKDVNGKTVPYNFLSFFDDETVKAVFKDILLSFRTGD